MLPLPKKHILKCQKKLTIFFVFTYPQSKCVCKVSLKTDTFYGLRDALRLQLKETYNLLWRDTYLSFIDN
jgi:hypothetical protein